VLAVILAGLGVAGLPPAPVAGNGAPVNIALLYIEGISNWGPTNAAGIAELVMKEGEVRLTATGLQPLQGEDYRLSLLNTSNGDQMALATFRTGDDRVARLDLVLNEAIPEKGWNLLLVSVGPDQQSASSDQQSAIRNPQSAIRNGGRRSIAGRFPLPESSQGRPAELPRTGDGGPATDGASPLLVGALGLLLGVVATLLYGRGRRGMRAEGRGLRPSLPPHPSRLIPHPSFLIPRRGRR
jgi:hypothetical protein